MKTVSTGGIGATGHGGGPDALFSQDSVLVSKGNLFVVNVSFSALDLLLRSLTNNFIRQPGSNTLSAFALNSKSPTSIRQIGKAISTSGEVS